MIAVAEAQVTPVLEALMTPFGLEDPFPTAKSVPAPFPNARPDVVVLGNPRCPHPHQLKALKILERDKHI